MKTKPEHEEEDEQYSYAKELAEEENIQIEEVTPEELAIGEEDEEALAPVEEGAEDEEGADPKEMDGGDDEEEMDGEKDLDLDLDDAAEIEPPIEELEPSDEDMMSEEETEE